MYAEMTGQCVFIMNHQSNYDLVLGGVIRVTRSVFPWVNEKLFWFPIFWSFLLAEWEYVLIKRENPLKSIKGNGKSVTMDYRNEKNLSILIMPEGTRSKGKRLRQF